MLNFRVPAILSLAALALAALVVSALTVPVLAQAPAHGATKLSFKDTLGITNA